MKKVIDTGNRSITLRQVKPVENIHRNQQSFLEISPMGKEVHPSHNIQGHVYENHGKAMHAYPFDNMAITH